MSLAGTIPDTLAVLREARGLYAANPSHSPSEEEVPEGCVCLLSATQVARDILGVSYENEMAADILIRDAIGAKYSWPYVADWNAEHSTAEGLAVLDRAIAACGADS